MDPLTAPFLADARIAFGYDIRRSRQIAGLSQQKLASLSGVSQSVISRLERGKAPRLALERLLMLHHVLGNALPLGACPHDHHCIWRPLTASGQRSHTEPLASGLPFWGRFRSARPLGRDDPAAVPAAKIASAAEAQSPGAPPIDSSVSGRPGLAGWAGSSPGREEARDGMPRLSPAIFPWDD